MTRFSIISIEIVIQSASNGSFPPHLRRFIADQWGAMLKTGRDEMFHFSTLLCVCFIFIIMTQNLTLENCGGKTVTVNGTQYERYASLRECSTKRGIPYAILKEASKRRAPGFCNNGGIKWELLQPYLAEHFNELSTPAAFIPEDDMEALNRRKLLAQCISLENFNKSKSDDFVSKKETGEAISRIAGTLFARLTQFLTEELPSRCHEMPYAEIKKVGKDWLQRQLTEWKHGIGLLEETKKETSNDRETTISSGTA